MEVLVLLGLVILELIVSKALELAEFRTMNPVVIDISLGVGVMSPRPDTMVAPRPFTLPVVLGRDKTPVPTRRPDGPRDIRVPDTVAAGPPIDEVVALTTTLPDLKSTVCPPTVTPGVPVGKSFPFPVGRGTVLVPITRLEMPRDIDVPDTVTAGPPTDRVIPLMATFPDSNRKVCHPTMVIGLSSGTSFRHCSHSSLVKAQRECL